MGGKKTRIGLAKRNTYPYPTASFHFRSVAVAGVVLGVAHYISGTFIPVYRSKSKERWIGYDEEVGGGGGRGHPNGHVDGTTVVDTGYKIGGLGGKKAPITIWIDRFHFTSSENLEFFQIGPDLMT